MPENSLPISELQRELTRLPAQLEEKSEAVTITRYGKPVMVILPYETYQTMQSSQNEAHQTIRSLRETIDSLLETIEIMQDSELMAVFRESVKALQNGELVDWEDAKRELGLS